MPWPRLKRWPGRRAARSQHVVDPGQEPLAGGEEQGGVEVALHGDARAQAIPALVQRRTPVQPDHVSACLAQEGQQVEGARAEVDRGHAGVLQALEDGAHVGQDELAVVGRGERAHPRVEDLHRLHARLHLREQVVAHHLGQQGGEAMPGLGLFVEEAPW